ncbi:MAG: aminopeptidase P family protein [Lachnospiraceae bacterium]|nr:aminopeptidase P family protein [Lachnospiraceae bacterium]MBQ9610245.1 aminopeptidase P family protein [Lachnospiraceae bacterium]
MNRLYEIMDADGLDALIITDGYNIHYLSGYGGHTGCMVITHKGRYILTDSRYTEQVTIEAPDFSCVDIKLDGYAKNINNIILRDCGAKKTSTDNFEQTNCQQLNVDNGCKTSNLFVDKIVVGFENEEVSYKTFMSFKDNFDKSIELFSLDDKMNKLRVVKNGEELDKIAMAEHIGDMAFSHILDVLKPGMTEIEVAIELENHMRKNGASGLSFDTIAASGKNSSLPHAVPTGRRLEEGDFLTMDFGCVYCGYCSDMTRTVYIGKTPSDKKRHVYETVLKAQLESMKLIKPGAKCSDIDKCARDIIADAGYDGYFGHGLGHSVGLFIHEEPRLSPKCDEILRPGITITVEPGIYIPGEFGVRIEDLVVVTEDGYKNFAGSPKELICI